MQVMGSPTNSLALIIMAHTMKSKTVAREYKRKIALSMQTDLNLIRFLTESNTSNIFGD